MPITTAVLRDQLLAQGEELEGYDAASYTDAALKDRAIDCFVAKPKLVDDLVKDGPANKFAKVVQELSGMSLGGKIVEGLRTLPEDVDHRLYYSGSYVRKDGEPKLHRLRLTAAGKHRILTHGNDAFSLACGRWFARFMERCCVIVQDYAKKLEAYNTELAENRNESLQSWREACNLASELAQNEDERKKVPRSLQNGDKQLYKSFRTNDTDDTKSMAALRCTAKGLAVTKANCKRMANKAVTADGNRTFHRAHAFARLHALTTYKIERNILGRNTKYTECAASVGRTLDLVPRDPATGEPYPGHIQAKVWFSDDFDLQHGEQNALEDGA
jgi:hypothetical protein